MGIEAGVATPALAERIGGWAADHTQRQVLEMLTAGPWGALVVCHAAEAPGQSEGGDGGPSPGGPSRSGAQLAPAGPGVHRPVSADPCGGS